MKKMLAIGVTIGAFLLALVGCTNPPHPTAAQPTPTATASPSASVAAADDKVTLRADGRAIAPTDPEVPSAVEPMVKAANEITGRPYRLGGGHPSFDDSGYDGSGAVSYVLNAGGQLREPLTADQLRDFGRPGHGRWVTVFVCSNGAHMIIGGMRFDAHRDPLEGEDSSGVRWRAPRPKATGCDVRHPKGL